MGHSGKPDLDYRFFDHAEYLDGFIETLGLGDLTLVLHYWGTGLGFNYAEQHPGRVKRIAFMEAIAEPHRRKNTPPLLAWLFKRFRDPAKGHRMNAENNFLVKRLLPMMVSPTRRRSSTHTTHGSGDPEAVPMGEHRLGVREHVGKGRHYIQEDQPVAIGVALSNWLECTS